MPKAEPTTAPRHRFAPAKINLALHVVGRREDGYHLLDMLVAFADIGDRIAWTPGGDACRLEIQDRLTRPDPIPADTSNLAWRALALAGRLGARPLAGRLTVDKSLPSGAGIGGGSSDAAATLRALLAGQAVEEALIRGEALALGADLPICLAGHPARVEGIGERITPVTLAHPLPIVLVWPGAGLGTPEVFRARRTAFTADIAAGPTTEFAGTVSDSAISGLARDPLSAIAGLRNDLEEAACALLPAVGRALAALQGCGGCRLARMSGSGSTVVGYFTDPEAADDAAAGIARAHPSWWVRAGNLLP